MIDRISHLKFLIGETKSERLKNSLFLFFILGMFVFISYLMNVYSKEIYSSIDLLGFYGVLVFIAIIGLSVVFAPVTEIILIPVASHLWGWKLTALYSIIGWTFGSYLAFFIASRYGKKVVEKIVSLKSIKKVEKTLSNEQEIITLVLLRILIPVDLLSYAIGLFSDIDDFKYILSTILGVAPYAILFAYLGVLPLIYQIVWGISGVLTAIFIGYFIFEKTKKIN